MSDREQIRATSPRVPRLDSAIRMRPENLSMARKSKRAPGRPGDRSSEKVGADEVRELEGVYIISVAARLLEMHPQTLRKYERLGLVRPSRTIGMLRLYSQDDIEKLRLIKHLEENLGLNLAGVELTLGMLGLLLDMFHRLSRIERAEQLSRVVEQEMLKLFESLNLPVEPKDSR